jgi:RHS repeat-associated protein
VRRGYKYGFNGKENDSDGEWGRGILQDFGDRIYSGAICRWLTTDAKYQDFPSESPYNYCYNSPTFYIDPDGNSPISIFAKQIAKAGLKLAAKEFIEQQIKTRLTQYASKKFAKQLMKDADAALEALDTEWWEYAIEIVPIIGDAYGVASMTGKVLKLYNKLDKLKDKAERLIVNSQRLQKMADIAKTQRSNITKAFGKVADGFQVHHIIPIEALMKNEYVQKAMDVGFNINDGKLNGIPLPKGFHGSHGSYNKLIDERINAFAEKMSILGVEASGEEIKNYMEKTLIPELKKEIMNDLKEWQGNQTKENNMNSKAKGRRRK